MCFVLAVILGVFAYSLLVAGKTVLGLFAAVGSIAFFILMVRNIIKTKRNREKTNDY